LMGFEASADDDKDKVVGISVMSQFLRSDCSVPFLKHTQGH